MEKRKLLKTVRGSNAVDGAGVKLVSADTPEELVRLLHEEAKAF